MKNELIIPVSKARRELTGLLRKIEKDNSLTVILTCRGERKTVLMGHSLYQSLQKELEGLSSQLKAS
ncbi:MAG: type II toxin-antitoxin system prevent-host-death family antitoxin [Flavobacteriaceae bacterium]